METKDLTLEPGDPVVPNQARFGHASGHLPSLPPGDPVSIAGSQPLVNTVVTNESYTTCQNDSSVICLLGVTITLNSNPIIATPVQIIADSGNVTVTGPIQDGPITVLQGTTCLFAWSPYSSTYSVLLGSSGGVSGSTTIVNHSTGAYTVTANNNAMVDTTSGSISTITLGTGILGSTFEVSDYGQQCDVNNITVAPAAGMQLEDPNNPGVYQLANTTSVFKTPGLTCRWRYDGTSKYKIVGGGAGT